MIEHRNLGTLLLAGVGLCLAGCGVISDGHNRQGVRSLLAGDPAGAYQSFQAAASSDPRNADSYYNMAATLHRVGVQSKNAQQLQQAETLYNQALDLSPNHTDTYRGLAVLLAETQRSDKAFKLINNWVLASPANADARVELARLYDEFGQPAQAVQQLQIAINQDQQNRRAWLALGKLREQQGDLQQALQNYNVAYQLQPQPEVGARIASLGQRTGTLGAGAPGAGGTFTATPPLGTGRY